MKIGSTRRFLDLAANDANSICHDFATTRLALIRFIQRIRDFSSREICFYAVKADYALYAASGPRLETV